MKVLHVSPSYYPAFKFGGPIQSVHLLNKELARSGVMVDVFTTNAGLKDRQDIPVKKWVQLDNLRVKYFDFIGYEHYNFTIPMFKALLKEVKNYDIVHITAVWNFPVWAACFACWMKGKPYIISPRGTIYKETIAIKSSFAKKLYYKLLAKKCIDRAAAVHYTSKDEKENVEKFMGVKSPGIVIPNGVDLSEFNIKPDHTILNEPYILFLGRINKKKGIDILFEAFAKLLIVKPELKLVIAGPDSDGYKIELDELAMSLHISENLVYTGSLQGEQKIAAYKGAQLFVLTSYSENFGMSVVEAMACSCPVLISDKVGIADEIVTQKAGIIVQTNPESILEGLKNVLQNDTLRKEIAENGFKMAHKFYNIEQVANTFLLEYQRIIKAWQR